MQHDYVIMRLIYVNMLLNLYVSYYRNFSFLTGLSPDLQSMEQIRRIARPTDVPDTGNSHIKLNLIKMSCLDSLKWYM